MSHLLDVMVDAEDYLKELGVHVETCTNEASAAAMLGASINYPVRGAVTWKAIVGTNVASDALSNLASPGVMGGAMIIVGEDYGEGGAVIQERSHAYAMKSSIWLLDPRPDLPSIVRTVEKGFELSGSKPRAGDAGASHPRLPRHRLLHRQENRKPDVSVLHPVKPAAHNFSRLSHPPVTFAQERIKVEERMPAARDFIRREKLNEMFDGDLKDIGIIVQGGLYNGTLRARWSGSALPICSANAACRCCA